MEKDLINYMGHLWIQIEGDIATVGINEEGLEDLGEIVRVSLPSENESLNADEVCGEIETDEGSLNLYSPVEGKIHEINPAVVEEPELIVEDNFGDGWLFKIQADDDGDLEDLVHGRTSHDDDDEDEDDDEEEDEADDED
jgi:glycine cleavage system H protein